MKNGTFPLVLHIYNKTIYKYEMDKRKNHRGN